MKRELNKALKILSKENLLDLKDHLSSLNVRGEMLFNSTNDQQLAELSKTVKVLIYSIKDQGIYKILNTKVLAIAKKLLKSENGLIVRNQTLYLLSGLIVNLNSEHGTVTVSKKIKKKFRL